MNCQNHADTPATAYCRTCGKPVCDQCRRDALGTVYCADHIPAPAAAEPPPAANPGPMGPPPAYAGPPAGGVPPYATAGGPASYAANGSYAFSNVSPGLAIFLGLIPGVGAIYNGQYAKGIIHAVIWGILMSIASADTVRGLEPVFVILIMAWWAYMVFEAYHTARRRRAGEPVDEYSSILNLTGGRNHIPVAGIVLVGLGALLLLHTLNLLDFERVTRFWPVLLIAAGVYLLAGRFLPGSEEKERRHER